MNAPLGENRACILWCFSELIGVPVPPLSGSMSLAVEGITVLLAVANQSPAQMSV